MPTRKRRTKIVTTLGPATDRPGVLEELIRAGANVVRLNFSHGTFEDHQKRVQMVREASAKLDMPVAIMGDLQGPKIRIGKFKDGPILLKHGDIFVLDADLPLDAGTQESVGLTYQELPHDVKPGDILLLDDGRHPVVRRRSYSAGCHQDRRQSHLHHCDCGRSALQQ